MIRRPGRLLMRLNEGVDHFEYSHLVDLSRCGQRSVAFGGASVIPVPPMIESMWCATNQPHSDNSDTV